MLVIDMKESKTVTIANGESVSSTIDTLRSTVIGLIFPAAWTTAALTIEVSADNATWIGLAYDNAGYQCNCIASPAVSSAYSISLDGMLPYRYIRLRSGTTATPVNQGGDRAITVITRPMA